MNSKQRAYLRKISAMEAPIFQVGKSSVTPELTATIDEALEKKRTYQIKCFKNCFDDPRSIAEVLADRTHSSVVHVIGRKIVLYRPAKEEKE